MNALGYHTIQFWRVAVPYIFDSDMSHGTKYRDALLFSLTLYDVNTGKSRLKELYAAVPGIRKSLLGVHAKRFGEQYHHLQRRKSMSRSSLQNSVDSLNGHVDQIQINGSQNNSDEEDGRYYYSITILFITCHELIVFLENGKKKVKRTMSIDSSENSEEPAEESYITGGLAGTHFQQRVINVSNAPPVSLKREKSGEWEIKQGSGGLVSCVDPVMSVNHENMWLANLGMNLGKDKKFK